MYQIYCKSKEYDIKLIVRFVSKLHHQVQMNTKQGLKAMAKQMTRTFSGYHPTYGELPWSV
ncbi:MAG: hypothetical protein CSA22_06135 [Deltaproteobacteria bacterium]|nr:MAG: hypothetical protein CSA22_06135 [Deltaproteobacteria bacterium]